MASKLEKSPRGDFLYCFHYLLYCVKWGLIVSLTHVFGRGHAEFSFKGSVEIGDAVKPNLISDFGDIG